MSILVSGTLPLPGISSSNWDKLTLDPGLSGSVIQILLYPCAKVLEFVLPDWGITVWGVRHSLNPGPWTFKEQMFATITFNIAIYTTNSYGMILVQKSSLFYGEGFITFGYQLMLTLFVQLMGMGFAGYLRRFSVYPVKALWPTLLPIIAMNRALVSHQPPERPPRRETNQLLISATDEARAQGQRLWMDYLPIQILLYLRTYQP